MNQTKKTRLLYSISSVIELLSIILVSYCVILSLRKANTAKQVWRCKKVPLLHEPIEYLLCTDIFTLSSIPYPRHYQRKKPWFAQVT